MLSLRSRTRADGGSLQLQVQFSSPAFWALLIL